MENIRLDYQNMLQNQPFSLKKVPLIILPKLKEKYLLEMAGAVSKINHPTEWVISHFVVKKKNGSLGLCLDPKDLIILRDFKTISSPEKVSCKLHNKEY